MNNTVRYKLAVCLYGQFRTGEYCLPWIAKQYEFANTRYYVHTKTYSKYVNVQGVPTSKCDALDVKESFHLLGPKVRDLRVISEEEDHQRHVPGLGIWHYASMFTSMQAAVYAALRGFVADNWYPDAMIVQRADMLLGPTPESFGSLFAEKGYLDKDTLYVLDRSMRFDAEARQYGIHDIFLMGSMQVINSLVAETVLATQLPASTDWQRYFFFGPNVFLRKCVEACGIHVEQFPIPFALVRPDADMKIPVFESFGHHASHWIQSHPGMNKHS